MRLSPNQRAAVDAACLVVRPGAKLVRVCDQWAAVWHVTQDGLCDPDVPVAPCARWRGQLVVRVDGPTVWWSGEEHRARNRRAIIASLMSEARQ